LPCLPCFLVCFLHAHPMQLFPCQPSIILPVLQVPACMLKFVCSIYSSPGTSCAASSCLMLPIIDAMPCDSFIPLEPTRTKSNSVEPSLVIKTPRPRRAPTGPRQSQSGRRAGPRPTTGSAPAAGRGRWESRMSRWPNRRLRCRSAHCWRYSGLLHSSSGPLCSRGGRDRRLRQLHYGGQLHCERPRHCFDPRHPGCFRVLGDSRSRRRTSWLRLRSWAVAARRGSRRCALRPGETRPTGVAGISCRCRVR
jgi:hypothetical protein